MIAIDIETYDPNLKTLGDGSCRKDGRILCVGAYGENIERVFDFDNIDDVADCRKLLVTDEPKIFHNGVYDLSWLYCGYEFEVNGTLHDTMTRMVFIDEYADLGLDDCCKKLGVGGKNKSDTIEKWYAVWQASMKNLVKNWKKGIIDEQDGKVSILGDDGEWYTVTPNEIALLDTGLWKKDVWHNVLTVWADPDGKNLMKLYNLQDCKATFELFQVQEKYMEPYREAYQVECDLYPLIMQMKKVGVRIDMDKLEEVNRTVEDDYNGLLKRLEEEFGVTEEMLGSSKKLGERLNAMGIHSPVTSEKTGAESWSFTAKQRLMHYPVMPLIVEAQGYQKLLSTYMRGGLRDAIHEGRIHCTFSPNKREDGGTVTGRFACSKPNLQQVPARDKYVGHSYGQDMRAMFLPEEGCMIMACDYSQIEYLLLAHYAQGWQAQWFQEQAQAGVDFHNVAMSATGIPYRQVVKTFNYGVIYGMGWQKAMHLNYVLFEKLAAEHGLDIETYTRQTMDTYHKNLPVIKATMNWVQDLARKQGYVTTLGGRREHKPKPVYDPDTHSINDFIYKMLNKLIQGSAADVLKFAMRDAYREGVFKVLTPHLTVHDELVVSVPFNEEGTRAAVRLQEIMNNSFHSVLKVPMKACAEVGPNWGYWSDDIWEEMKKGNFDPELFNRDYRRTH